MTADNFCLYLQNRLLKTSQTGGQWYSDTSPFSIPWFVHVLWSEKIDIVPCFLLLCWVSLCRMPLDIWENHQNTFRILIFFGKKSKVTSPLYFQKICKSSFLILRCPAKYFSYFYVSGEEAYGGARLNIASTLLKLPYFIEYNGHTSKVRTWISLWFLVIFFIFQE